MRKANALEPNNDIQSKTKKTNMNSFQESHKSNPQRQSLGVSSFMDSQVDKNSTDITAQLQELIEERLDHSVVHTETLRQALVSVRNVCIMRERETNKSKFGNHEDWSVTQDIVVCLPRLATAIRKKFLEAGSSVELKIESYQTLCEISRLLIAEDYEFDEIFHIWRQRMAPIAFEDASSEESAWTKWAVKFLSLLIPDMSYSVLQDEESKKYVEWIANFPKSQQLAPKLNIILRRATDLKDTNDQLLSRRAANMISTWSALLMKMQRYSQDNESRESAVDTSVSHSEMLSKTPHDTKSRKENEAYSEDSQEVFHTPPSSKYRHKEESKLPRSAKKNLDSDDFAWITHNQADVIEEFATSVRKHAEIVARMSNIGCLDNEIPVEKDFSNLSLKESHVENQLEPNQGNEHDKENDKPRKDSKVEYSQELKALHEQVTKRALEEAGIVIEEYQNLLNKYQAEFRAKIELEHVVQQYEATLRKTISQSQSQMNVRLMTLETEKRKLTAELMAMKEAQQQKLSGKDSVSMEQMNEKDEKIRKQEELVKNLQNELWKVEKDYHSLRSDAEMKLSQAFKQVCLYRDEYLKQSKALHDLQDEVSSWKKSLEESNAETVKYKQERQKALDEKEKLQDAILEIKRKVESLETQATSWKRQYEEKCSTYLQLQAEVETLQNWKGQQENVENELYDTKKQLESLQQAWKEVSDENQRLKVRVYDQSQELEHLKTTKNSESLNEKDSIVQKLQSEIEAKTKENKQLGELCEELLSKLEGLEKKQSRLEYAQEYH